ncbi:MAG: hypothetical protein ACFFC6_09220 [Promethearchaeota archaeon]
MKGTILPIWRTWFLGILLVIILGSTIPARGSVEYRFVQLNSYFENDLFGLVFDYNPQASTDQSLHFMTDLISQTSFPSTTDPDLQEDNIIALVGHESHEIKSAFLAIQKVKRTQDIIFETIEWETTVPFTKYLHQFTLPTGEDVLLGQDFLGMALKVNGSGFDPTQYQLGYANVPLDFLEFILPEGKESSFNLSVETSIGIQESMNKFQIDLTYSNLTFLFQTASVDLDDLLGLETADHLIIAQFDRIVFSTIIKKYSHQGISGVETISEISIGNTKNLIINEELPTNQDWTDALEYEIEEDFKGLIPVHETFSWYQGSDIKNRLQQFSDISFSLITAQNIGVLNGTQAADNFTVFIDDQNRTSSELSQKDIPVTEEISVLHNEQLLFSNQVMGRNFAVQQNFEDTFSLIPLETQVITLNQQRGFADNLLFQQETSLLKELVAECVKHFITDPLAPTLGTNEILIKGGLDLTSAQYIQDFQVKEWSGAHFKINLIQYAIKTAPFSSDTKKPGQLTHTSSVLELLGIFILVIMINRKMKAKNRPRNF